MKSFLPLLLLLCSNAVAQKLITNKTDEFTGKKIKETSVETLAHPLKMSGFSYNFAFKNVDDKVYFNLKIMSMSNSVFAIKDGEVLMIKFDNDSVINLSNMEYTISKKGAGGNGLSASNSQGASLYFQLSNGDIELIKNQNIVKVRLYTTEGYTEQEIKAVADKRVKAALNLVL